MTGVCVHNGRPIGPIPAFAGIGLRAVHHEALLQERPAVGWLEVHTENYFHAGGAHVRALEQARERYPISLHGVGLGLGSLEPLDREHLRRVRAAVRRFEPALVSEHACWGSFGGEHFNDLLPLPYTEEALEHLAARVACVQDFLGRQLLIENLSCYVAFKTSRLTEGEFLSGLVERCGCALLLDVNNLYINAINLGFDAEACIAALPAAAVKEIHLAGHRREASDAREILIDDHGSAVAEPVWSLYRRALDRFGPVATLVEWDTRLPALGVLVAEARRAQRCLESCGALAA